LEVLVGARPTRRLYQGNLQFLFAPAVNQTATAGLSLMALELTKRSLAEQLMADPVFTSTQTARHYPVIYYADCELKASASFFWTHSIA
jgi:hypothetical protein